MKLGDWVALFCLAIALVILWQFRQILLLLFTSIVLAIALNSLVRWLQKFGLERGKAVLLALAIVVLFGILFLSLVMPPFLNQFEQLIQLVPVGYEQFIRWVDTFLDNPPGWMPEINLELPNVPQLARQVTPLAQNILGNFFTFFNSSIAILLQVLLVFIFTLMLLSNPLSYRRVAVRLFPSFYRRRADEIFSLCEIALLQWMGGIAINSVFITTLSGIGLLLLNINFVLAHALLAGIFNLVPNIGPTASVIFPVSVALLDNPLKALAVIVLYIVIQNVESYWFSPMIMQKQVSLLPAATLVAQLFFARFLGLAGLVLALPLAVVTKTWIEEAILKDILDQWAGAEAVLEPAEIPPIPDISVSEEPPILPPDEPEQE
ncbi:MAG: AI-2E family transporter [Limnospira sp.]